MTDGEKNRQIVKSFVYQMRKFILRSNIFHLDLSGMMLGKIVNKLIESIKASSTICVVHLSQNGIP